jgi:hypothetical protein
MSFGPNSRDTTLAAAIFVRTAWEGVLLDQPQRAAFSPRRQSWRRSALHWVDALAAVPATEKG